jgi:putative tricarboxylic transport membrane protein
MSVGLAAGIVAGTLPGLTATMAVALLVPVTFIMEPASGLVLLGAIWCGAIYGGANAAILLNIPGTPSSIATTLDGYPMTKNGQADKALLTSLISSVIGGIIGVIILLTLFAPLAQISLKFGKPEYFWLCIFGLTTISAMSTGNVIKGLLGGTIGLLLGTIGLDPVAGVPRFTFGYLPLIQGIQLVPALIGFFAFSQMLILMEHDEKYIAKYKQTPGLIKLLLSEMIQKGRGILLRSSILGTFIGMLPGAGGPVASIIAYNEAVRWDKNPEKYGKGAIEGIMASESSNNAVIGGALIPMMGLGIPGCPVAAVIMGGLLAHGIVPGSKLLAESGDVAYTFITSLVVANILMLFVGYFMLKLIANILNVPLYFVAPIILVLSSIGSYALRNSMLDVFVMVLCGTFAYILSKVGIDPGPLSLGLVLGPIAEDALGVSLVIAQAKGSILDTLFLRPLCLILIILSILSAFSPLIISHLKNKNKIKLEVNKNDSTCC